MPLANGEPGREISAAARQAFGAVGAALPADGDTLALLHPARVPARQAGRGARHVRPVRPRRTGGCSTRRGGTTRDRSKPLLQGAYAHLGGDRLLARAAARAGRRGRRWTAEERFARWRMHTAEAIETLAGSGALTPLGVRFVDGHARHRRSRGSMNRSRGLPWRPPADGPTSARRPGSGSGAARAMTCCHRRRGGWPTAALARETATPSAAAGPPGPTRRTVTRRRLAADLRELGLPAGGRCSCTRRSARSAT